MPSKVHPNGWVTLDQELIERCLLFGQQMVAGYAAGRMLCRKVFAEADRDVQLQALAKMAECACALYLWLSVDDLDWFGERKNGDGHDLVFRNRYLFDIKHTEHGRRLIWPVTKNDDYWRKDFNCLALVIGSPPKFEVAGVISKERFFRQKEISDGSFLAPGTWWLDRRFLSKPYEVFRE